MPKRDDEEICMRLVEYTRSGRVLRRWTFERCGEKSRLKRPTDPFTNRTLDEGLSDAYDDDSTRHSRQKRATAASPLSRGLKQERIFEKERRMMEEEAAEERRRNQVQEEDVKKKENHSKNEAGEKKKQHYSMLQANSTEPKRRSKEKHDLNIDERAALKEMSELYRDLLERFEILKQRQESQMGAESDSIRLRRLAEKDDTVIKTLHELIDTVKEAASSLKTCAMLAGSSMKHAEHYERELDHILLELECAAVTN